MLSATERESGLSGLLVSIRKRWTLVLASVLVFVGLAGMYSLSEPDRYESTAVVLLAGTGTDELLDASSRNVGLLTRESTNELLAAESDAVVDLVVAELGEIPNVRISVDADSDVMLFTGIAPTPADAALYANTWAQAYIEFKRDEAVSALAAMADSMETRLAELAEDRELLEAPLVALQSRIVSSSNDQQVADLQLEHEALSDDLQFELELNDAQTETVVGTMSSIDELVELSEAGGPHQTQIAAPPAERSNAPASRNIALGLGLGLLVGLGLAFLAESRGRGIESSPQG